MPRKFDDDRDDDDDRPRRRRNRDDDDADDADDRPRRRRSSRPEPKSNTKLILGIVGGVFLAFFLVCGGLGFMMFRGVKKGLDQVQAGSQSMQQSNNLKQIGLGMHAVSDVGGNGLVGPYTVDAKGKVQQGLSFRVGLLPYIEQDQLFRRFDLTKAWDAPENIAAGQTNLMQYSGPAALGPTNQTPYRVFYGGGALFETDGKPVNFTKVTDGTSNTIMAVTAVETVPWAKPQEFAYSKTTPLPPLALNGGAVKYLLLMADGSTRFVTPAISETVLRQAIEKADGAVINWPFE